MNIQQEIRRRRNNINNISVSDKEFYCSAAFKKYAQDQVNTLLRPTRKKIEITVSYDPRDNTVAYTNNSMIFLNAANSVAKHYSTSQGRFMANMGILFHECAHCLYLDFGSEANASSFLQNGSFWPDFPQGATVEEQEICNEIKSAMNNVNARSIFKMFYHELSNIISDAHDEAVMCSNHGKFVSQGIAASTTALQSSSEPLEDLMQNDNINPLCIMFSLALQYVRYFDYITLGDEGNNSEYIQKMHDIEPALSQARYTDDTEEKFECIHRVLIAFWPYIKEMINQDNQNQQEQQDQQNQDNQGEQQNDNGSDGQKNQNNSQSSGQNPSDSTQNQGTNDENQQGQNSSAGANSNSNDQSSSDNSISEPSNSVSKETAQKIMDQLQQAINNVGLNKASDAPQDRVSANADHKKTDTDQQNQSDTNSFDEQQNSSSAFDAIKNQIAQDKAEREMEELLKQDLPQRVSLSDMPEIHQQTRLKINRNLNVNDDMVKNFQDEYGKVKGISKSLQKRMINLLREMNDDDYVRKAFGPTLKAEESYRMDGKFFYKQNVPADIPNMSIGVLIDQSGSMSALYKSNSRLYWCKQAAILLNDFADGINIPVMVAGHNATGDASNPICNFNIYIPFEKASQNDKYRLMDMRTAGCNRDGMALSAMVQMMQERSEDVRLLIIISDGLPHHYGYRGESAYKDMRNVCKKAEKDGIQVIAAGIGEDRDILKTIYGDRFLDISDLSQLPKTLVKLVEKKMLN